MPRDRISIFTPGCPKPGPTQAKPSSEHGSAWRLCRCVDERMNSVMARRPWSFKEDRRLMELAKSSTSLEEAAKLLGRSPDAIKRMALRLGLSLKSKGTKKN
ncbi:hypothetical protein BJA5080_01275 [Bradyrhizobium diazoefficiens SEMIA 5080]|uniref:Uncharacterized protein n=3 Tax=Nitrobacteraceae TaxID=41294 RepID=A0A837CET4_9BRAD|nr:hypothetical protein BJA5080_01275 [Bradyrhizobium diazoefficiens SEMIA 5080]